MEKYSVFLLVLMGAIIVAAGSITLLKEAGVLTLNISVLGPTLAIILGLWVAACAVECRQALCRQG